MTKPKMTRASFPEYAKHRGVSHTAVYKAAREGRIPERIDPETGKRFVYVEEADREWELNTDDRKRGPSAEELSEPVTLADGTVIPSIDESRAIKEDYLARTAKIDYETRTGKLIPIDDVIKGVEQEYVRLRARLLGIPVKLAAELAITDDSDACRQLVEASIQDALSELTRDQVAH